jgi:hypothetical protein
MMSKCARVLERNDISRSHIQFINQGCKVMGASDRCRNKANDLKATSGIFSAVLVVVASVLEKCCR